MTFAAAVLALFDILVTQICSGPIIMVLLIFQIISLAPKYTHTRCSTHKLQRPQACFLWLPQSVNSNYEVQQSDCSVSKLFVNTILHFMQVKHAVFVIGINHILTQK